MPPKLQVDESFAFLFTCIEASGCKVDFKMVGDATDLQPAAARMRYTRLRKAVEAGHFKGATLVQPTVITASLSQLANPLSRRIGNFPQYDEEHEPRGYDPREACLGRTHRRHFNRPLSSEEEQEEEEGEIIEGLEGVSQHEYRRKRLASTIEKSPPDDHQLFFPDTSMSSRTHKRLRGGDSDSERKEPKERNMRRASCSTEPITQQPPVGRSSIRSRVCRQADAQQDSRTDRYESQQGASAPIDTSSNRRDSNADDSTRNHSAHIPRKKTSANAAAEAAFNMGIRLGKWPCHPDEGHLQVSDPTYMPTSHYAQGLAYVGQGLHPPSISSTQHDTNHGVNTTDLGEPSSQLDRAVSHYHPHHQGAHFVSAYHHKSNPFSTINSGPSARPVAFSHQNHSPIQNNPGLGPQTEPHPPPPPPPPPPSPDVPSPYNPSDPNRLHPASVFDGFNAPRILPYTPSSLPGIGVQKNGEISLLHKIRLAREEDKKPVEHRPRRIGEASNEQDMSVGGRESIRERVTENRQDQESTGAHKAKKSAGHSEGRPSTDHTTANRDRHHRDRPHLST